MPNRKRPSSPGDELLASEVVTDNSSDMDARLQRALIRERDGDARFDAWIEPHVTGVCALLMQVMAETGQRITSDSLRKALDKTTRAVDSSWQQPRFRRPTARMVLH